jgi:hypothetical protein
MESGFSETREGIFSKILFQFVFKFFIELLMVEKGLIC